MIQIILKIVAVLITVQVCLALVLFKLKAYRQAMVITNIIAGVFLSILYFTNGMLPYSEFFMLKTTATIVFMIVSITMALSETGNPLKDVWIAGTICLLWFGIVMLWLAY